MIDWKAFAELNNMSEEEFTTEILSTAMALCASRIEKEEADTMVFKSGGYVLTVTAP